MIVTRVTPEQPQKSLRLLCLHGHGGTPERLCNQLEDFFKRVSFSQDALPASSGLPLSVECRCLPAPLPEESRRPNGRQWWRYDEDGNGDRPLDWAEMELATNKLAEELWRAREAQQPYDGVLGFSQGAEMVHTLALLQHAGDVRFTQDGVFPRFLVSLSGAVNPGHFEWPSGNGPPPEVQGPTFGPQRGTMMTPCLFVGDYHSDNWYPSSRFSGTQDLYADKLVVPHAQRHAVPKLDPQAVSQVQRFLLRFARRTKRTRACQSAQDGAAGSLDPYQSKED